MTTRRIGGRCSLRVGAQVIETPGEFTFGLGLGEREAALAAEGAVGYRETPTPAFIEGEVYYQRVSDIEALTRGENVDVQLDLASGIQFVLPGAWFAGDGEIDNANGTMAVRWEAPSGRIVT